MRNDENVYAIVLCVLFIACLLGWLVFAGWR